MKRMLSVFSVSLLLAVLFFASCNSSVNEDKNEAEDTTLTQTTLTVIIPEEFRKEWTELYIEEGKYYESCNPAVIQFRQDPESGNWQLLQNDLLSAETPKTIVSTKVERGRLTLHIIGHEGDTMYYVLEKSPSTNGIVNISFYTSADNYRKNEKVTVTYYVRGEYKEVILPPMQECDFGDQPGVFIDSSYIVENTFCNLQNGDEEIMKFQFKLTCKKDGTLIGTANYDVGVGLAEFKRGSWQMEERGVSFNIITAGQFPANGDSLVEYSRQISIGSYNELQTYKQCK